MDCLSLKENTEYEIILSKLKLDVDWQKWVAGYAFNTLVGWLIDNYSHANRLMSKMEARLVKTGRFNQFNGNFRIMWTGECLSSSPRPRPRATGGP